MGSFLSSVFSLEDFHPGDFAYPQWPIPPILFLFYRLFFLIFCLVTSAICLMFAPGRIVLYLTNWAFFVLNVYQLLSTILSFIYICKKIKYKPGYHQNAPSGDANDNIANQPEDGQVWVVDSDSQGSLRIPAKICWVAFSITISLAPMISVVYWPFIHHLVPYKSPGARFATVSLHGVNILVTVVELTISAAPVKLSHIVYPMIFAAVYGVFHASYAFIAKDDIYPIISFSESPGPAIGISLGVLALSVVSYLVCYGVYKLRMYLFNRCICQVPHEELPATEDAAGYTMS